MNEKLLSKPVCGWTTFCLGNDEYRLSYLSCVPLDWLNAAIHGLEQLTPFAVHGFCESGRFLCLVSYWNCHIIFEDDEEEPLIENEIKRSVVHIRMIDFCKMLYEDIKNNIDAWGDWNHDSFTYRDDKEKAEKSINKMKDDINSLLNRLNELIIQQEEHFGENRFFC